MKIDSFEFLRHDQEFAAAKRLYNIGPLFAVADAQTGG
jgi:hypothetical protein